MLNRINVTKSFLPPIEEYYKYLKRIWENEQLTNQGPLLKLFEERTANYLGVSNINFVTNGTTALQLALKALEIESGEVITTPFTYVATTSAILWERCKPIFVDIDPSTLNIDPDKIEEAITPKTKAILAVHVFGNPCDVQAIGEIAKRYNLKVIYDAAHAFGVKHKNKSIFSYGDASTCSFHATKLFHTIEGGAIFTEDADTNSKVEMLKRFGHEGDDHRQLGINAKSDEFRAAMGLCNLRYIDNIIEERKRVHDIYNELLRKVEYKIEIAQNTEYNYAYYPIIMSSNDQLRSVALALNENEIYPRRYFYPSLNKLKYLSGSQVCPISEDISSRILCLPMYSDLATEDLERICTIVNKVRQT